MEFDCLANILFNFLLRQACGNATIKVGRIGRIAGWSFFNNNQILHSLLLLQASLFKNAVQGSGSEIVSGFSGQSDKSGLRRVFVLPVTAFRANQIPSILFEQPENISDFQLFPSIY
jgi:hypothetical protein